MAISGVYQVVNIANDKRYIGSSVNLKNRWAHHKSRLNNGKHGNQHLQRAWNRYGEESFEFEVICYCSRNKTIEFEQFFLDTRHPEYNMAKCARASMLGAHHTAETLRKISEAMKGQIPWSKGKHHSEEALRKMSEAKKGHIVSMKTREKISEANKGKHSSPLSAETRRKMSEAHKGEKNHNYGKQLTEEHKRKIGEANKGKKPPNWINFTPVELEKMRELRESGASYGEIAKVLDVSYSTVRNRIKETIIEDNVKN